MGKSDFETETRSRSRSDDGWPKKGDETSDSRSAPTGHSKAPPPPPKKDRDGRVPDRETHRAGDLFSAGPAKKFQHNPDHPLYKTAMCREYDAKGFCTYGAKCNFAHGKHELKGNMRARSSDHKKSRTRSRSRSHSARSRSYSRSRSRGSPAPAYSPGDPRSHPLYKTSVCFEHKNTGKCPNAEMCRFAHGKLDLRIPGRPDRYQFPDPSHREKSYRSRSRRRSPSSRSRSRSRKSRSRSRSKSRSRSPSKKKRAKRKRKRKANSSSDDSSSDSSSSSSASEVEQSSPSQKMDTQQALLAVQSYEAQVQMACLQGGVPLQHPQIQQYLLQLQQIQLAAQSAMLLEQSKKNAGKKKKKKKKKS